MMTVSLVIRTYRSGNELPETLEAVARQRVDVPFETVFVDSGSDDDTLDIIRRYLAERPGRLETLPAGSFRYGRALNRGFEAASGKIVVALSSHCPPLSEKWLTNLIRPIREDENVCAAYGRQEVDPRVNPFDRRSRNRFFGPEPRIFDASNRRGLHYSNANAAVRRAVWRKHPFDETLPFCEDEAWAVARIEDGARIAYVPTAAVAHTHPPSPAAAFRVARAVKAARRTISRTHDLRPFADADRPSPLAAVAEDIRNTWRAAPRLLPVYPLYKAAELLGWLLPVGESSP